MRINYEDYEQELILHLIELLHSIDISRFSQNEEQNLHYYICTCLKNKYLAILKEEYNELSNVNKKEDLKKESKFFLLPMSEQQIEEIEFKDLLNSLSEKQQKVMVYRYYYKLSVEEIAQILNITRQAVNQMLNRSKKIIRKSLIEG